MSAALKAWYATDGDESLGVIYAENRKEAMAKAVEISGLEPYDFNVGEWGAELRRERRFDRYAPNDPPPQAWLDAGYALPCDKCGRWVESDEAVEVRGEHAYHARCAKQDA